MSAAPKPAPPADPRKEGSPPGPVQWCANCVHFRPGPIVVQGSTLGGCFLPPAASPPAGSFIEVSAQEIYNRVMSDRLSGMQRLPRETLASAWCSQHKQRVGVLT